MIVLKETSLEVDFDHFQFLVGDRKSGPLVDTATMWEKAEPIGVVHESHEVAGISTVRYGGKVRVSVRVSEDLKFEGCSWNQLGKFEIDLPSGELMLWGPENFDLDEAPTVAVSPGRYEAVAYSNNTNKVVDEMESEGSDEYLIVLSRIGELKPV